MGLPTSHACLIADGGRRNIDLGVQQIRIFELQSASVIVALRVAIVDTPAHALNNKVSAQPSVGIEQTLVLLVTIRSNPAKQRIKTNASANAYTYNNLRST